MLELKSVCRSWNGFSLENISLTIEAGEYFALLGPSGAGKSLLLSTIAGIYLPSSGTIHLGKHNITMLPPEKRCIGYVFQRSLLFPHMSVKKNILFGMRQHKFSRSQAEYELNQLNELLDLSGIIDRPDTSCLSGGEAQKVALARALAIKPHLLLLDEPMSSMDFDNRAQAMELLKKINHELKLTTIHVTHDINEAKAMAHRIGKIKDGSLLY